MSVIIVGAGIAGLVAARRLALKGETVTVLEKSSYVGGCVRKQKLGNYEIDCGVESFSANSFVVKDLLQELGIYKYVEQPNLVGVCAGVGGRVLSLPVTGVLGVPTRFWDLEILKVLGFFSGLKFSVDFLFSKNYGFLREEKSFFTLGEVVQKCMGKQVLDKFVDPVVRAVYGVGANSLDIEVVMPGLRKELLETGSLAKAVKSLFAKKPGGLSVLGLRGGMFYLVDALRADLVELQVQVHTNVEITGLQNKVGVWEAVAQREVGLQPMLVERKFVADRVVVATGGKVAVDLLKEQFPKLCEIVLPVCDPVFVVTLLVSSKVLNVYPCGGGVFFAEESGRFALKSLSHVNAKWGWVGELLSEDQHIISVSYSSGGRFVEDVELFALAVADVARVFKIVLLREQVVAYNVNFLSEGLSAVDVACGDVLGEVEKVVGLDSKVGFVGSWVSGSGLDNIVAGVGGL